MARRRLTWLAATLLLAALLPLPARSQVEHAGAAADGLVSGNDFLISHVTGDLRGHAAVAFNDDLDEYMVVWSDSREGATDWDIYAQRFGADGVPHGPNFAVRDEGAHFLAYPDVAYDLAHGRYLVVWEDLTEYDVEGQIVNGDGSLLGAAVNVADGTSTDPRGDPAVDFFPGLARYAVVYRGGLSGDHDIYAQVLDQNAGPVGSELNVATGADDQAQPDVAVGGGSGQSLIVWQDEASTPDHIYGRRLGQDGTLGAAFEIATSTTNPSYNPAVAFSPNADEWLVVYARDVSGDSQITGRRVSAGGAVAGSPIYICDDANDQSDPDVAYDPVSHDYLVVWEHDTGGSSYRIYGRPVSGAGAPLGTSFAVAPAGDSQIDPALAAAAGGYLVAWRDGRSDDIGGQRVSSTGARVGGDFTVSLPTGTQRRPAVAYNHEAGQYLAVWVDERDGNNDVWGQRLDSSGDMLGNSFVVAPGSHDHPDVAYNPDVDQYLVVWEDDLWIAIYGQRVNANGTLDGSEITIAGSGTSNRREPRVVFNPIAHEYLVVYTFESATDGDDIRGRRVPSAGDPTATEFEIAGTAVGESNPEVAVRDRAGGGGYLVVWRETDGTERDVRGQRLNQEGTLLGGALGICVQADSQWSPDVAYHPGTDRYLVIWPDDRNGGAAGRDVYGRQVGGTGTLYGELPVSTAAGVQERTALDYAPGPGTYVAAWDDARTVATAPDLYGQQIDGNGGLVGGNEVLFAYAGWQENPALALGDAGGLLAWRDGRDGTAYHIYGRLLGSGGGRVFLPVVVKGG